MNKPEELNASCGCGCGFEARAESVTFDAREGISAGRKIWLWGPVAVWATLILVATSLPAPFLPPQPFTSADLVEHGGVYGVLAFLLFRALARGTRLGVGGRTWLIVVAIASLYGAFDEAHQYFLPSRYAAWDDLGADCLGAVLGATVYYAWRRWRP